MKNEKKLYTPAEMDLLLLPAEDVITTSLFSFSSPNKSEDETRENNWHTPIVPF